MSNDIERLLAAAADDADQPLHTDVEDILVRARRSVRRNRIATVCTAALTTAAIVGGIAAWSSTRTESVGPAGTDKGQTVTIDVKTGRIVDNETGQTIAPPPPVSPLSDAEVLGRCVQYDREQVQFLQEHKANVWDKAGPIDARWKVVVKSGDQSLLFAAFLSPDRSIVSTCTMDAPKKPFTNGRISTTEVMRSSPNNVPQAVESALWVPVPGAARVLVETNSDPSPRQALVGADGFYTLGYDGTHNTRLDLKRIRAYDADGKKIWELVYKPATPTQNTQPTVPSNVTVKTAEPITPRVVLTKDPQTGKVLAPAPPVSPLTDGQIRDRCRLWEDEIATNPAYGGQGKQQQDQREKDAGLITSSWFVALKTGTGDKFTAVLVSPDRRVAVWCHMTKPTTNGGESDYTRRAVNADGKFPDSFEFAMVPDGVAQIVVDLPKTGPTRALISGGYYIWGLTGGNSDIQQARVRGYDAQGKLVYDQRKQVDAS
ncbi:hypothetical protein ACGFIF_10235 [Kribbella sp. NPDC049174]|uniref:hypothetical protein n=1 Tax=Kribbella sp. NPDC049174 TaxID=3364112 RepID=UPI00371B490F